MLSCALHRLELLRQLGAREEPSAAWLLDELYRLYCSAGGRHAGSISSGTGSSTSGQQASAVSGAVTGMASAPLNANQRTAVLRAMQYLYSRRGSASDSEAVAKARAAGRLVVLNAAGGLCDVRGAVRVGSSAAVSSVDAAGSSSSGGTDRLLGRIDTARLTFVHPRVPDGVAAWLGCPALQVGPGRTILSGPHIVLLARLLTLLLMLSWGAGSPVQCDEQRQSTCSCSPLFQCIKV